MKPDRSFEASTCADQLLLAERELASFIGAVKELFGPEQARLSAEDWLEEFELMESPSRRAGQDWRAVTVAAAIRLASRLTLARDHRPLFASTDINVSRLGSSDGSSFPLLAGCV